MSHSSKIFDSQPIRVQNVNGFDLSHLFSGTAYTGTLTPCLTWLLMPDTKFTLGANLQVELPPLATQAFGRIDAHIEVFWVNCSILYGGWKMFISNNPPTSFILSQASEAPFVLPRWNMYPNLTSHLQSLDNRNLGVLDYVRFSFYEWDSGPVDREFNLLPLLCYHRIWDCFYRNPQVTRTIFAVNPDTTGSGFSHNVAFIHHSYYRPGSSGNPTGSNPLFNTLADLTFPDGKTVFELRQRNWANDYFTAASPDTQLGQAPELQFKVDLTSGDGAFTISSLRTINSLTKFLEASNYDPTYRGILRANFGVSPGDADTDEPLYLGRIVVPIYQKGVYQTGSARSGGDGPVGGFSNNPFVAGGQIGAKTASGSFRGEGSIVDKFKVTSFGYLFGIFSLVPHAQLSQGIDRMHTDLEIGDYPFPLLQSVGMDAVKDYEVYASNVSLMQDTDFAYLPRYSRFKYICDTVHGELRPGRSFHTFVVQRQFFNTPAFSTAFLEIPRSALDNLFSIESSEMLFSCWFEVFWSFKAVMPLAEFCVPTLGELQDTHEIRVKQGGSRL